ncbi:MAG TPA: hypothetical protein VMF50_01650, partial [Candidatus Binataceae bacterium]|nr:hypothetical protein [Candidatus Binataceae bacterium]
SNTYSGVAVGAWHDANNAWNAAIVNSNSSAENVVVQFPSTAGLPTGTVEQINYTSSITDTNENSDLVTLGSGGQVTAGPASGQVTIPVPAYGFVVAQGTPSSAAATPTASAAPTTEPTATPTATASAAPTTDPTATSTPIPPSASQPPRRWHFSVVLNSQPND